MTDEEYTFNQTVAERSVVKNSAFHKKGGPSTSKLGNKRMTNQEIEDRHGEVEEYDLGSFMNFNDFKAMPKEIQVEYINRLQDKYDIGIVHISRFLFHLGDDGLQSHLRINGILKDCNPDKRRTKFGLKQFQDDIKADKLNPKEKKNTVPLGQFISYEDYCKFSAKVRATYVNSIIDKYGVGVGCISEFLFGKSSSTLDVYFHSHKMRDAIHKVDSKNMKITSEKRSAFKKAVSEWRGVETKEETEEKSETAAGDPAKGTPVAEPVAEIVSAEPVAEEIPEVIPVEASSEEPLEDSANCGMVFRSSFTGNGIELERLKVLATLFEGKNVRVSIEIAEVA